MQSTDLHNLPTPSARDLSLFDVCWFRSKPLTYDDWSWRFYWCRMSLAASSMIMRYYHICGPHGISRVCVDGSLPNWILCIREPRFARVYRSFPESLYNDLMVGGSLHIFFNFHRSIVNIVNLWQQKMLKTGRALCFFSLQKQMHSEVHAVEVFILLYIPIRKTFWTGLQKGNK